MIYLQKNTQNTVILELSQLLGPTATDWLFEFIWEGTNSPDSRYFVTANIAPTGATERYDQFLIEEGATGSTATFVAGPSAIYLNPGQYVCNIFGTSGPVTGLTGPTGATTIAASTPDQIVRMVVSGTTPGATTVYNDTYIDTTTPSVYQ
jgi:hypothetical protein